MSLLSKIRKIKSALKSGGYKEICIAQVNYGDVLKGKNILVTGGSSGIGYYIAKKCASCGAHVIITGRNVEKLEIARDAIGNNVDALEWDITDFSGIEEKLNQVNSIFGGDLNCLVNNAGIQPEEFFPNVSEKEWDTIYSTNSKGLFFLSQAVSRYWIKKKSDSYRRIINIDSQGGFVGATYPYRMVKWDVRGLTQGLGLKLVSEGILVNAIAPGIVRTDMQPWALSQGENLFCDQNPLRRVSLPEEVAELAVFMLSDACSFMVGQTVVIDGGYSLK